MQISIYLNVTNKSTLPTEVMKCLVELEGSTFITTNSDDKTQPRADTIHLPTRHWNHPVRIVKKKLVFSYSLLYQYHILSGGQGSNKITDRITAGDINHTQVLILNI
jgi:hypothetical protein